MWRTTGSNCLDNRAFFLQRLSWKELRVDDWGFWVFVGVVGLS